MNINDNRYTLENYSFISDGDFTVKKRRVKEHKLSRDQTVDIHLDRGVSLHLGGTERAPLVEPRDKVLN